MLENIKLLFSELYQLIFIISLLYSLFEILTLGFKLYGKFILEEEGITYNLTPKEKIAILFAVSIIITYLI